MKEPSEVEPLAALLQMWNALWAADQITGAMILAYVQGYIHGSMYVFTQKRLESYKNPSCLDTLISLELSLSVSQNNSSYAAPLSFIPDDFYK